jgi:hypothetical protein
MKLTIAAAELASASVAKAILVVSPEPSVIAGLRAVGAVELDGGVLPATLLWYRERFPAGSNVTTVDRPLAGPPVIEEVMSRPITSYV